MIKKKKKKRERDRNDQYLAWKRRHERPHKQSEDNKRILSCKLYTYTFDTLDDRESAVKKFTNNQNRFRKKEKPE